MVLAMAVVGFAAPASAQTLDAVRARGHLVCAATNILPGFAQRTNDLWSGFDVDICRGIAAAVLGDPDLVEFRALSGEARFAQLQTGEVDVIARNAPWTLSRDTLYGAHYVTTTFYDGLAFMVPQSLGVVSAYEFENLKVCLTDDPDERAGVAEFFFDIQARYEEVLYEDRQDLRVAYAAGLCQAVVAPASWLNAMRRSLPDPPTQRILPERISKEPLGPVVREGDDEWFNIVKWTVLSMIDAEELGVTSLNLDPMTKAKSPVVRRLLNGTDTLGASLRLEPGWIERIIRAVGNYGEIYDRNFGAQTGVALSRGLNSLWTKGGLLYAPPIR